MNFSHFYFALTEVMACLYKAKAQSYISYVVKKAEHRRESIDLEILHSKMRFGHEL